MIHNTYYCPRTVAQYDALQAIKNNRSVMLCTPDQADGDGFVDEGIAHGLQQGAVLYVAASEALLLERERHWKKHFAEHPIQRMDSSTQPSPGFTNPLLLMSIQELFAFAVEHPGQELVAKDDTIRIATVIMDNVDYLGQQMKLPPMKQQKHLPHYDRSAQLIILNRYEAQLYGRTLNYQIIFNRSVELYADRELSAHNHWLTLAFSTLAEKGKHLLHTLEDSLVDQGTVLIYVSTRKKSEQLAAYLRRKGIRAKAYHFGFSREERLHIESSVKRGLADVVVSTSGLTYNQDWNFNAVLFYETCIYDEFTEKLTQFTPYFIREMANRAGDIKGKGSVFIFQDTNGAADLAYEYSPTGPFITNTMRHDTRLMAA